MPFHAAGQSVALLNVVNFQTVKVELTSGEQAYLADLLSVDETEKLHVFAFFSAIILYGYIVCSWLLQDETI